LILGDCILDGDSRLINGREVWPGSFSRRRSRLLGVLVSGALEDLLVLD
jgi:hypothetical protein